MGLSGFFVEKMEPHHAEEERPAHPGVEVMPRENAENFLLVRKIAQTRRDITVDPRIAVQDEPPEASPEAEEMGLYCLTEASGRLREVEKGGAASRPQDPGELGEGRIEIRCIADRVAARDKVSRGVGKVP